MYHHLMLSLGFSVTFRIYNKNALKVIKFSSQKYLSGISSCALGLVNETCQCGVLLQLSIQGFKHETYLNAIFHQSCYFNLCLQLLFSLGFSGTNMKPCKWDKIDFQKSAKENVTSPQWSTTSFGRDIKLMHFVFSSVTCNCHMTSRSEYYL
jgi:hypothetical protein